MSKQQNQEECTEPTCHDPHGDSLEQSKQGVAGGVLPAFYEKGSVDQDGQGGSYRIDDDALLASHRGDSPNRSNMTEQGNDDGGPRHYQYGPQQDGKCQVQVEHPVGGPGS